jgi:hypothetical protein
MYHIQVLYLFVAACKVAFVHRCFGGFVGSLLLWLFSYCCLHREGGCFLECSFVVRCMIPHLY